MTFQIVEGQWYNSDPMSYNKLRGSEDTMFPKEILEILTI